MRITIPVTKAIELFNLAKYLAPHMQLEIDSRYNGRHKTLHYARVTA